MISIIILTHNELDLLKSCLRSVFDIEFEVIVIDNASSDGTENFVKSNYPQVLYVKNKVNQGVARARNQGVVLAHGDVVMFLDSDAKVSRDSIRKMYEYLRSHDEVSLVGPKLIYPDGRIQESPRKFPTVSAVLIRGLGLEKIWPNNPWTKRYLMKDYKHDAAKYVDWVLGACQMIKRDVFDKIGMLDEKYFFGYEDIDFCRRIKQNGSKVVYLPDAEVVHLYQRKSTGFNRHKLEHIKSIMRYFSRLSSRPE